MGAKCPTQHWAKKHIKIVFLGIGFNCYSLNSSVVFSLRRQTSLRKAKALKDSWITMEETPLIWNSHKNYNFFYLLFFWKYCLLRLFVNQYVVGSRCNLSDVRQSIKITNKVNNKDKLSCLHQDVLRGLEVAAVSCCQHRSLRFKINKIFFNCPCKGKGNWFF